MFGLYCLQWRLSFVIGPGPCYPCVMGVVLDLFSCLFSCVFVSVFVCFRVCFCVCFRVCFRVCFWCLFWCLFSVSVFRVCFRVCFRICFRVCFRCVRKFSVLSQTNSWLIFRINLIGYFSFRISFLVDVHLRVLVV